MRRLLEHDLSANYDVAIHLGQAPGTSCLRLESIGINVRGKPNEPAEQFPCLVDDGPVAYRTKLHLEDWIPRLRSAGIPAQVSYHAGEYLCNATLYLSHYFAEEKGLKTRSLFVHLPLDVTQTAAERHEMPSLPSVTAATGLRLIIEMLRDSAERKQLT